MTTTRCLLRRTTSSASRCAPRASRRCCRRLTTWCVSRRVGPPIALTRSDSHAVQVDAVFWLDIVLTFCTGLPRERECLIECVLCAAHTCSGTASYARPTVQQVPARSRGANVRLQRHFCSRRAFGAAARRSWKRVWRRHWRRRRARVQAAPAAAPSAPLAAAQKGKRHFCASLFGCVYRAWSSLTCARSHVQLENMSSATMFRVMLLVSAYILIGHWAACIFFYLSKWQARAYIPCAAHTGLSDTVAPCSSGIQPAAGRAAALDCCHGS